MKVTFIHSFKSIPANTTVSVPDVTVDFMVDTTLIRVAQLSSLIELGIVSLEDESVKFQPKLSSSAWDKVRSAIPNDMKSFTYGNEYLFYNVEDCEWKVSTLKQVASHIGRIMSGFAIPLNSTYDKKTNRLRNLNEVYGLGLSNGEIYQICE